MTIPIESANRKMTLAIIGAGAIATEVIARLPEYVNLTYIIASSRSLETVKARYPSIEVIDSISKIEVKPDFIIECAGHQAVKEHGPEILAKGWDLHVISTGAFADESLFNHLHTIANLNHCQLHLLSGAIAGMDGLKAARQIHHLDPVSVIYKAIKPSKGWIGTHAETLVDLTSLVDTTCFFEGSAREAAKLFPQNANVAATIALCGIGFDDTTVALHACPNAIQNQHFIDIKGQFGHISLTLAGYPLPNNPKTSFLTALSILQVFDR